MKKSEQFFIGLLEDQVYSSNPSNTTLKNLGPNELGNLYVNSAFLISVIDFLTEELWLRRKEESFSSFNDFLGLIFEDELSSILFLKEFLEVSGEKKLKKIKKASKLIEHIVLLDVLELPATEQKKFTIQALKEMSAHFVKEEKDQEGREQSLGHKGPRCYRSFDNLDDIFKLNYELDRVMEKDHSEKERVYAGSGVGVQSGYSTILLTLDSLDIKENATMIDLGSGYGRVGLVCSLLRPSTKFFGYEFIEHRVEVSNKASEFLDLQKNLSFITQDLSLPNFKIPPADVYYLYDPFTKETYDYVLNQIVEISKTKNLTIVTKGNARNWLLEIAELNKWPAPKLIDEGNLCIFKTCDHSL